MTDWSLREHDEVLTGRVRDPVGRATGLLERQLSTEDGGHPAGRRREREPHDPVEPVVVGDRERGQSEARGLVDQLLGMARTVEEREVRVAVQLGIAALMARSLDHWPHSAGTQDPEGPGWAL